MTAIETRTPLAVEVTTPAVAPESTSYLGNFESGYFDTDNFRCLARRAETLDPLITSGNYENTDEWRDAQTLGSMALSRFIEQHPGMGQDERDDFADIVVQFAFNASRLAKKDPIETPWTHLSEPSFYGLVDTICRMYLSTVFTSDGLRIIKTAMNQSLKTLRLLNYH